MRFFVLILTFAGYLGFGATFNFPLLEGRVGGMDKKDGVTISKRCQIFDDHSAIKLSDMLVLISKANEEPINKFVHIVRQVPSGEIWANYPTTKAGGPEAAARPRKVLLWQDSSSGQRREGPASEALIKMVAEICKDL